MTSSGKSRRRLLPRLLGGSRWPSICERSSDKIVGALRISNDLERVGDLAENIAKRVLLLAEERRVDEVVLQLRHMVDLVRDRLTGVLQSYERRDATAALDIWRKDQEIDALNSGLFRELLTFMMEDPRSLTFCTHMLFTPRISSAWGTM